MAPLADAAAAAVAGAAGAQGVADARPGSQQYPASGASASQHPDPADPVFAMHVGGKLEVVAKSPLRTRRDLSLAYTPGVAEVSRAIAADPTLLDVYTGRGNTVAVVSDGTAVLGLGDIGPGAAMPVMEGKAMLFKHFANIDAVPICLDTTDPDEIVETVARLAPTFGGINLEDISAPRCFEIERRLQERLDLPVFHDDQHGTAVVVLAALRNAALVVGKPLAGLRVVISGAGAAGVAIAAILARAGVRDVVVTDSRGVIGAHRTDLTPHKVQLAAQTNPRGVSGGIAEALAGADVYVGVSGGTVPEEAVAGMNTDSIVFALANPDPEVHPDVAVRYAAVVGTGRSDFPNQINNVLAFPGIFRGALDVRATRVSEGMKLAAAVAIADTVEVPSAGEVVPSVFDERVVDNVAAAVAEAARSEGIARR
ncbi:NADP-dependent malic enzyme [Spongisporangium articulatum]|uniref:NADP-dependent malic enzyme n=1 Tax=Spongisporangium articulatum TaxID=3362603 RepID=A0ABW8AUZ1_9ACTN